MDILERESQFEDLESWFAEVESGHGRLALIGGEAGIGKSTLIDRVVSALRPRARILVGACEPQSTPTPLGPVFDIVAQADDPLRDAMARDDSPRLIFAEVLREIGRGPRPTILVIEDVHWADDATLDLLRYLSRRLDGVRVLIAITYRDDEIGGTHPLRRLLGELTSVRSVRRMSIQPLSRGAVSKLAAGRDADPEAVYQQTGGNPFFVTEVLASRSSGVPETVQDAVLARAAGLGTAARDVLAAAAEIGQVSEPWLLASLPYGTPDAVEECISAGMFVTRNQQVGFRHEIARQTILANTSLARKLDIHRSVLAILSQMPDAERNADRLAYHADEAKDGQAVLRFAHIAATNAGRLGAHRQEAAQYERALRYADSLPDPELAELLEAHAYACYLTDAPSKAMESQKRALKIWRDQNNSLRVGRNLRMLSRALWANGQSAEAERIAQESLDVLTPLHDETELARSLSAIAGLHMLARRNELAIEWGERAIASATAAGDLESLITALTFVGSAQLLYRQPGGEENLERSLELALAGNLPEHAGRAFTNLGSSLGELREYAAAMDFLDRGIAYCAEHDLDHNARYMESWRAKCLFYLGRWPEATTSAETVLANPDISSISTITALYVLGRIRTRRGDPDATAVLDRALVLALETDQIQRLGPVRAARAEAAFHAGNLSECIREASAEMNRALETNDPWLVGEFAYWLWRAGADLTLPEIAAEAFAAEIKGDWQSAADRWHQMGCPYETARALTTSSDEAALVRGWQIMTEIGSRVGVNHALVRMQEVGVRHLPRGPRPTTRKNSAGLTRRELDVLARLSSGQTNVEIARDLFLSPKTVEHHVSSILAKLQVSTRMAASVEASRRGLLDETR